MGSHTHQIRDYTSYNMERFLNNITEAKISDASEKCRLHTAKMLKHFLLGSQWALKMIDSSTKFPTAMLWGNKYDFGNYDECLSVDVNEEWGSFVGQHCITEIPNSFHNVPKGQPSDVSTSNQLTYWSLCIPSTCSAKDLEKIMRNVLSEDVTVQPHMCHSHDQQSSLQIGDCIVIALLVVLALLCFTGTIFSIFMKNTEKRFQWLFAFSWYKNGKSLFSLQSQPDSIGVLHGIRFFSIAWVVLGHSSALREFFPQKNTIPITAWRFLCLTDSVLAVDSFFLLSGILLCYIFMKTMDKGHPFNIYLFYLHRFFRVFPVLGFIVLLETSILAKIGTGPLWDYSVVNSQQKDCKAYWWSTILFIQNYINIEKMCIPVAWFLSVDMQLYLLSPIFLLALYKKPKLGIGLLIGAGLLGIFITFQQAYTNHDRASNLRTRGHENDRYYQTHTRYVPWIIGLACGYLLYRTMEWRNRVIMGAEHLSKKVVICGWILSMTTIIGVLHWVYPFQQEDRDYSVLEESLYIALSRPLWALGISWIVFACSCGYGGFVNTILAWNVLLPLSRLTFSIYLVHFDIIVKTMALGKVPIYTTELDLVLSFFGFLVLSVILSIIVCLTVEVPAIGLEKILFNRVHEQPKYKKHREEVEELDKKHLFSNSKIL